MADDALLIGDLAVNPAKVNDYLDASFNSMAAEVQAALGGVINFAPADSKVLVGQIVYAPQMSMPGALGKLDVTNETDKDTVKAPAGVLPYGPVCSNVPDNPLAWLSHAIGAFNKNDQEFEAWLADKLALRVMEARMLDIFRALRGAIGATSTVSHVNDESSQTVKTLQVTDVMDAKAIMGDRQGRLRVMVMHSKAWLSLKKNLVTGGNYSIQSLGDMTLLGNVPGLEGMKILLFDDATKVAGASAGLDAYYTFLLGEGAVTITPRPNSPQFTAVVSVRKGARSTEVTIEDHFALNLAGMAMTTDATGNPTAAELYDTANWTEAPSYDHRDFPAVYIKTLNG